MMGEEESGKLHISTFQTKKLGLTFSILLLGNPAWNYWETPLFIYIQKKNVFKALVRIISFINIYF